MNAISLIGGMSYESTIEYYRIINKQINKRSGGLHSTKILIFSLDFDEVAQFQKEEKWNEAAKLLIDAAKGIEGTGADFILICTNTMHKVAGLFESNIRMPLIHIADVTAEAIKSKGLKKTGLLGTKFSMEQDFLKNKMTKEYGIEVIVPYPCDREVINEIIYDELCLGEIKESSRTKLKMIIQKLIEKEVERIVLGCTELPLLLGEEDSRVPLIDTCRIHAEKGADITRIQRMKSLTRNQDLF